MKLKKVNKIKFIIFKMVLFCIPFISIAQNFTFDHNGVTREYILYKPSNIPTNAPLVFVLHGYTGNNQGMIRYGMNDIADKNGFVVCYPQGLPDNNGTTHWNAKLKLSSVDDIGFLSELAKHLQSEHNLDPNSTFSCGFSNGGFMSYTLASEAPGIFKAVAPVSGLMSGDTWNEFNSTTPITILHIHGSNDRIVPINGSMSTSGGWGGAPKVDSIISFWAHFNNCKEKDTTLFPPKTTAYYNRNGDNGHEVWYYLVEGMAHEWPTSKTNAGIIACEVIWEFFKNYISNTPIVHDRINSNLKNSDNISVFPNLANAYLRINNKNATPLNYKVIGINGRLILSGSTRQSIYNLDITTLSRGIYLLHLDGRAYSKTLKFQNIELNIR